MWEFYSEKERIQIIIWETNLKILENKCSPKIKIMKNITEYHFDP